MASAAASDNILASPQWAPEKTVDSTCNILIVGNYEIARRAASDILMRLQSALKLTGAVVFTNSTDPLLLGNILPDDVVFRNSDYVHGVRKILGMQRDAHQIRAPDNRSDTPVWKAVQNSNADRISVVLDAVATSAELKNGAMRDLLTNGRHENIVNIVCVSNVGSIAPEIRAQFDYVLLAYTNNIHDIKNAWKSVFGMFPSAEDLQEMLSDLTNDMLLVANMCSSSRSLSSIVSWYLPDVYRGAPITRHIVNNRGKWHLHTQDEVDQVHESRIRGGAVSVSVSVSGADGGDGGGDSDGDNRGGGREGGSETAGSAGSAQYSFAMPRPRVVTDRSFLITGDTILAIRSAMRDV